MGFDRRSVLKEESVPEIDVSPPVHLMAETHSEPLSSFGMLDCARNSEKLL
jgi:hypothetical protein